MTRGKVVLISFTSMIVLAACGQSTTEDTSEPRTSDTTAESKADLAQEAAIDAYNNLWETMAKAGEIPDPSNPDLEKYASGEVLDGVKDVLRGYQDKGWVSKGRPSTAPQVVETKPSGNPTTIELVDCGDSTKWTVHDKETGDLVDDGPHGKRKNKATVERRGDAWKVTAFQPGKIGSC